MQELSARVSNTLHTCDGKVSSELTKELAKISSERTGLSPVVLETIFERTESLYSEIKKKIRTKFLMFYKMLEVRDFWLEDHRQKTQNR